MARRKIGEGQTALVTGASSGIGLDLAECFAKDGYNLILTARSGGALDAAAERLRNAHGVVVDTIAHDLGAPGGGAALATKVAGTGRGVDVLVNNAGYGSSGPLTHVSMSDTLGMIDLNDRALVELTHLYWNDMIGRKRGGVLNVASTAAFQPGPLMAVYYASKAFVLSFSEALWEEARGTDVKVSCLCPGPTESRFRERAGTGDKRLAQASTPMTSMDVAKIGYRGFQRNERVVITGGRNKMLRRLTTLLPRATVLRMVRNLQEPAT